ncbi:MAG: hypothetical protein F4100_10460 [Rhodothermaceae bacterium]|nr:hypothetical protein [Bacteroidota bacterium]MXW32645.1 hypothetical protein [Rhodothermaceae bacterium]MYE62242.1 hypothetical protein [Rhodothermaceae bacterium]MYJ21143.1 hypothetical protein [Rhodothermaceae bacterium]
MKYLNNLFRVAIIILLMMAGCDSSVMEDGSTDLTLNLNAHVNGKELSTDSGTTFDVNGVAISFASARMYLSEITLIESEDGPVTIPDAPITVPAKNDDDEDISHTVEEQIILVRQDAGVDSYDLGTWPAGNYKGIRFKVGIDGWTNRIDPSQVPAGHPLAKQTDRNNHWNWNAGYLYLRIDGQVDTDADTVPDEDWAVHLGTQRFLREVTLTRDFTLENDQPATLDISIDYGEFLKNVDLSDPDQRVCHTMNNLPVANAVADQISSAFKFGSQ